MSILKIWSAMIAEASQLRLFTYSTEREHADSLFFLAGCEAFMRAFRFAVLLLTIIASPAWANRIYVTTKTDKISSADGCSLKEAVYSARLHTSSDGVHGMAIAGYTGEQPNLITTECVVGDGVDDTIVLPTEFFQLLKITDDADNFMGPTATPMITTRITIEGNGAALYNSGPAMRLFAVGPTGHLSLKFVTVQQFAAFGGNGGPGAGGGMGAGGAMYVNDGTLEIESCTFVDNQAHGGKGGEGDGASPPGGGGGLSGWGASNEGGGGGGSRGMGDGFFLGTGGGTLRDGTDGGFNCGGSGLGGDAPCSGGGGGKGGGKGAYGGGGGGGDDLHNSDGGSGGFGGGGGRSLQDLSAFGDSGGNGGFGGGAGAGSNGFVCCGGPGQAGLNGGGAGTFSGGGGAALGGAIFNDRGDVTVQNSTFFRNSVYRGDGGLAFSGNPGGNGADLGAAIYSFHGSLKVLNSTISSNQSTGPLGGVIFDNRDLPCDGGLGTACLGLASGSFTLQNTIIGHNGGDLNSPKECSILGDIPTSLVTGSGNLIMQNDTSAAACPGLVAQDDPQLGNLQYNLGLTPTMAIPHGSPAWGAADAGLDFDQRGQKRPSKDGHGYDIGAFELCEPGDDALLCVIPKFTEGTPRTLIVDSPTGGTTTPPAGKYLEDPSSVVLLTATANPGFYFLAWFGDVANDPKMASNAVIMDQEQKEVAALFQLHDFSFTANPTSVAIPLNGSASSTIAVSSLGDFGDQVSITLSGAPAGVNASVNPTSVTPFPGKPPVTSSLSFTLGSSVTPQTFTETVTGASTGIADALTHSAQVSVTVVATAAAVVNVINQDQVLGCIDNSGIGQSLIAKINAYNRLSSGSQIQGATNTLTAFQYEVQAQTGQHIATTCTDSVGGKQFYTGQTLITDTQPLLATLGARVKANPIVGSVVNSSNQGIFGATVNLLSASKTVVATATTDAVGFYYFAETNELTPDATYAVQVTPPKGYKSSTPGAQSFVWSASPIKLTNFALN